MAERNMGEVVLRYALGRFIILNNLKFDRLRFKSLIKTSFRKNYMTSNVSMFDLSPCQ